MKGMKKLLKQYREGFSLVELMIVVAIIGVLAAIAVPNYSKYQARSRQAEVRTMLANAYAALKSFAGEANNGGTYTACLGKIGGTPEIGARRFYATGFAVAKVGATCGQDGTVACETYTYVADATGKFIKGLGCAKVDAAFQAAVNASEINFGANSTIQVAQKMAGADLTGAIIKTDKFTVNAKGCVSDNTLAGTIIDDWTIDQDKRMINVASGI